MADEEDFLYGGGGEEDEEQTNDSQANENQVKNFICIMDCVVEFNLKNI